MAPKIEGGAPRPVTAKPVTVAAPPPPPPVVAKPTRPRSTRFEAAKPGKPVAAPPPPPYQELGKNLATTGNQVMPSKTGPISPSDWENPVNIVGNLRQDTGGSDVSGDDRCGPTNLLAASLLQGKDKAAAFLAAEAKSPNLSDAEKKQLSDIATAVKTGTASYDQLNAATALLYKSGNTRLTLNEVGASNDFNVSNLNQDELSKYRSLKNKAPALRPNEVKELSALTTKATGKPSEVQIGTDPRDPNKKVAFVKITGARAQGDHSGLDDGELAAHAKAGGLRTSSKPIDTDIGNEITSDLLNGLKKGEATVIRIGLTSQDSTANHFVTVGKLPDGRPYIYNPSPGGGDKTLVIGSARPPQPDNFQAQMENIDARVRKDEDGGTPRALTIK